MFWVRVLDVERRDWDRGFVRIMLDWMWVL